MQVIFSEVIYSRENLTGFLTEESYTGRITLTTVTVLWGFFLFVCFLFLAFLDKM